LETIQYTERGRGREEVISDQEARKGLRRGHRGKTRRGEEQKGRWGTQGRRAGVTDGRSQKLEDRSWKTEKRRQNQERYGRKKDAEGRIGDWERASEEKSGVHSKDGHSFVGSGVGTGD
jgi:hypothetical protein